jgi:Domain of unknown function (DUF4340)
MRKTTGIILLIAGALGAFVYFYDLKHTKSSSDLDDAEKATSTSADADAKPLFPIQASDVASITILRNGATVTLEKRPDGFYMTQPLATQADDSTAGAIASELSSERVIRTITPTPDQMATFGLANPAVTLQFAMQNGTKHALKLGGKDFSGTDVYAIVDNAKDVTLLSGSILTSSDKPVDDFRDQSVLHFQPADTVAFELKNESGEISATKGKTDWSLVKPRAAAADNSAISSFLEGISTARVSSFVDDASKDLAKYGLATPPITLRVDFPGGKSTELEVGKKDNNTYFAKVATQPFVFQISDSTYKTVSDKFFDLRDKQLIHLSEAEVTRLDVRNGTSAGACVKDSTGDWVGEPSADGKSKPTDCSTMWGALRDARAQEIYDSASGDMTSQLNKPVVEATLTGKSGKKVEVRISAAAGSSVYARTNESPPIFKLDKQVLNDLNPTGKAVHD